MLAGLDIDLVIRNYFIFLLNFILYLSSHIFVQDSNALLLMFGLYFNYFDYHEMIRLQFWYINNRETQCLFTYIWFYGLFSCICYHWGRL